jgi:DNA mismatch repair ATPase MutL
MLSANDNIARARKLCVLDESVATRIKGQTVVPNMVAGVMELVLNSLDAGCSTVDIRVDLMRWNIQVYQFMYFKS